MLELIFQGFFEWIYGMILEAWSYFSQQLLDIMSMDFAYLEEHISVLPEIRQSMLAVGWALLIGNLVFQAVRSMMTGLGFEAEDPKLLFARTFVFSFLLLASPQICTICLNMTSTVIDLLGMPDSMTVTLLQENAFDGLVCAWLLVLVCGVIVMFQSFRLIFEMAERYFILAVLTICAPLAFGMGGSRNTNDIFTGWCRMYGSMCLLMALNVVFVKMLLSVLSTVPTGFAVLPWMVLVITIVKVAKKADSLVTKIGLNPAMTGDSLGKTFPGVLTYIVTRTAVSQVSKAIGKNLGKAEDSRGQKATQANGTAGKAGNTAAMNDARRKTNDAGRSRKGTSEAAAEQRGTVKQYTTQQSKPQKSTGYSEQRRDSAGKPTTIIPDDAETAAMNGPISLTGTSEEHSADRTAGKPERRSSVPPGTVRMPSRVRQGDSMTSGMRIARTTAVQDVDRNRVKTAGLPNTPEEQKSRLESSARPDAKARKDAASGTAGKETGVTRYSSVLRQSGRADDSQRNNPASNRAAERAMPVTAGSAERQTEKTSLTRQSAAHTAASRTSTPAPQESKPKTVAPPTDKRYGTAGSGEKPPDNKTFIHERNSAVAPQYGTGQTKVQSRNPLGPARQEREASQSASASEKRQMPGLRTGMAGTPAAPVQSRPTKERPGRNEPESVTRLPNNAPAFDPASQESAPAPLAAPLDQMRPPMPRSGTAGTASTNITQTRQTVQRPMDAGGKGKRGPLINLGTDFRKKAARKGKGKKVNRKKHGKQGNRPD